VETLDSADAGALLTAAHGQAIATIARDFNARAGYWGEVLGEPSGDRPARKRPRHVQVTAVRHDPRPDAINGSMRVYYIGRVLYGHMRPHEFPRDVALGAASTAAMSPFDYFIWAGMPGDPAPRSDVRPLELTQCQCDSFTIDLQVRPQ
jgi:hypothetical protein